MILPKKKPKLFVDMDGVLAEWKPITIPVQFPSDKITKVINDTLYADNYYKNLHPYKNVVEAIKTLINDNKMDVYILSCYLPQLAEYPTSNPLQDKRDWLDEEFGDLIPDSHRIFVKDGEPKVENIPFDLSEEDFLLDDYTKNLKIWINDAHHPKGIKLLNPYNDTAKSWKGPRISCTDTPDQIKVKIENIIFAKEKDLISTIYNFYTEEWKTRNDIKTYQKDFFSEMYASPDIPITFNEWCVNNGYLKSLQEFTNDVFYDEKEVHSLIAKYINPPGRDRLMTEYDDYKNELEKTEEYLYD